MTENVPPSSSAAAPRNTNLITELNHNDVLLGRGSTSEFIGNERFRSLVEVRKEEYISAQKNKEKQKIARELFDDIRSLGGRFLKMVESEASADDAAEKGKWYEVEESVALEKCKQSLREHREKRSSHETNQGLNLRMAVSRERNIVRSSDVDVGIVVSPASPGGFVHGHPPSLPPHSTTLLPSMLAGGMVPCVGDVYDLRFQATLFALQQQAMAAQPMATNTINPSNFTHSVQTQNDVNVLPDAHASAANSMSQGMLQYLYEYSAMNTSAAAAYRSYLANNALSSRLRQFIVQQQPGSASVEPGQSSSGLSVKEEEVRDPTDSGTGNTLNPSASEEAVSAVASEDKVSEFLQSSSHRSTEGEMVVDADIVTATTLDTSSLEQDVSAVALEDDVLEFLRSLLENPDRPIFTEHEEKIEQATMTDEEKAAALSDLFGKYCDINSRKRKRDPLDLCRKSIEFLVHQMRLELEQIPEDEKRAFIEAQMKCGTDEFSDARLERFLRCEGMNAKLGAQRLVNYWEARREVFGPEKFLLRMTLSEALCDDLVALETCVCRLLPHLDTSGRQILLWEPLCHTREGYTSESMLRALWYVIEVTAQENDHIGSGVVMIGWGQDFTIWDYDDRLYERMTYFDTSCWPVKRIATHICCPPWIAVKLIKPIIFSLMDKHARSRRLFHDVPESQLLDVLSDYGILKEMLPTEKGGTVPFNQSEWIANRRVVELKDI